MFSLFKKKEKPAAQDKLRKSGPRYVYKPYENALAFRVEYRERETLIYPGWSKSLLYKIEEEKIYSVAEEKLAYTIIGKDIYDAAGENLEYRVAGNRVYARNSKNPLYELQDSIRVQGTI